jgi:hypothetical protein
MIRDVDVSGVSGTGHVAEVAVFSDGHAAVHWLSDFPTTTPHVSMESVRHIHAHNGATRFVPVDDRDVLIAKLQAEVDALCEQNSLWRDVISDLDRCPHGRHLPDPCAFCPTPNQGNPHLREGQTIGYTLYAKPIKVPAPDDMFDPKKWRPSRRG